jgi:2-polyprenyl-3-methyl-5-hydroxy-6-metoxy-1,4-benzoquinol methylase
VLTTVLKRIRSLGEGPKPRSVPKEVPPSVFSSDAARIGITGQFTVEDVDLIVQTISQHDIVYGSPWDDFRATNMQLPSWFRTGLDPLSEEYAQQQFKLWSLLTQHERPYAPEIDEKEAPLADVDAVRRPAYYARRDTETVRLAADQIIAMGMILKHSGVKPGARALEYGAGFGQAALALARLGVSVDTVDISATFCGFIKEQAQFFQVPLTPFEGRFGWNPRGDQKYDLIFFYEAFHHCADFRTVVHDLKRHLAPDGRVLLVGEPIARSQNRYLPYPWGLRLDAEPIAQVRRYGWLELGFTEEFLVGLFTNAGFSAEERIECAPSIHGTGYVFKHREPTIQVTEQWHPDDIEAGWNTREQHGRWTKAEARLLLDTTSNFRSLEIDAQNNYPFAQSAEFHYGDSVTVIRFKRGERKTIAIDASAKTPQLTIRARARVPAENYILKSRDTRSLGIFIRSVTYIC